MKRNQGLFRKLLMLVLSLVMVIGALVFIPGRASADTPVQHLYVRWMNLPVIGKTPNGIDTMRYNSTEYTLTEVRYMHKDGTGAYLMDLTEKYEEGERYYAVFHFVPKEGYSFQYTDPDQYRECYLNEPGNGLLDKSSLNILSDGSLEFRSILLTPYEKTPINSIDLYGLDVAVLGEHPDFSVTVNNSHCHLASLDEDVEHDYGGHSIDGVRWYDIDNGRWMTESDTITGTRSGRYRFNAVLIPDEGYMFTDHTVAFIDQWGMDGEVTNFDTDALVYLDMDTVYQPIEEIHIDDVEMPILDRNPDYTLTLPADGHYHLGTGNQFTQYYYQDGYKYGYEPGGVIWVNKSGTYMYHTDTFTNPDEESYYAMFLIEADDGYAFTDHTKIYVNGNEDIVDRRKSAKKRDQFFDTHWLTAKNGITKVNISGLGLPVLGEEPDYEISIPSGSNYYLMDSEACSQDGIYFPYVSEGIGWYDAGNGRYLDWESVFEEPYEIYQPFIFLDSVNGYDFTEDVEVTINGSDELIYRVYRDGDENNVLCVEGIRLQPVQPINFVEVTGLDRPVLGEHPDVSVSVPAGAGYHLAGAAEASAHDYDGCLGSGMSWYDLHTREWLDSSSVFSRAAFDYQADIILIADAGYYFPDNFRAIVNGTELGILKTQGYSTDGYIELYPTYAEFTDMRNPSNPFYDAVYWAADAQITQGINATQFGPGQACTRGQVVTFLWRAAGQPEPKAGAADFTDMPSAKSPFYKAILWASQNNITSGYADGRFGVNDTCTRGQIVTFLWRYAGMPEPASTTNPFTDVKSTSPFYKAILWAAEYGITKGTSDTTFALGATCTRGQIVTFLYRAE